MKKIFLFVIPMLMIVSCNFDINYHDEESFQAPENAVSISMDVHAYDELDITGLLSVIMTDSVDCLKAEIDSAYVKSFFAKVTDGTLRIGIDSSSINIKGAKYAGIVYIPFNDRLNDITISGACGFRNTKPIKADKFEVDISGVSFAKLMVEVDTMDVELEGASMIVLNGSARVGDFDVDGVSKLDAVDFEVNNLEVEVSGTSKAEVNCIGHLKGDADGTSALWYKGNCKAELEKSGVSSIKKL